ncbi:Rv3654c family TadE-like protein [Streptomyces californicus]|uniref:Rv3654c family TadE-like protein n=1 Tax=Streptomyces californicus TaxID=67351 RepID=UPI0037BAA358
MRVRRPEGRCVLPRRPGEGQGRLLRGRGRGLRETRGVVTSVVLGVIRKAAPGVVEVGRRWASSPTGRTSAAPVGRGGPGADSGADRGVATVWVAVTATALCTVFAIVLALGQAVAARHRAGGAADLAALGAADRALEGAVVACETARRVASAQGAELVRCAVDGDIADVTARARFGPYAPAVRARAGPPGDPRAAAGADEHARGGDPHALDGDA